MASYPVTVYRWDDPGAPQIGTGRASDIINIWHKCLVEGYGTKTPLGWTRPFYDAATQRAIFRNDISGGGSGGYVELKAVSGVDTNYQDMRMTPGKSLVSDNLVQPGYFDSFRIHPLSGNSELDKWIIFGTGFAFYFLVIPKDVPLGGTYTWFPSMFIGDIFSVMPNDVGRFITYFSPNGDGDSSSISNYGTISTLTIVPYLFGTHGLNLKIYNSDNSAGSTNYRVIVTGPTSATFNPSNTPNLPQIFHPAAVCQKTSYTGVFASNDSEQLSVINPLFRGYLPGLFTSLFSYPHSTAWPFTVNDSTGDYLLLHTPAYAPSTFIQTDNWYDPFN